MDVRSKTLLKKDGNIIVLEKGRKIELVEIKGRRARMASMMFEGRMIEGWVSLHT